MYKKISWKVIDWKKLWRTISFPTANIKIQKNEVLPWTYKLNVVYKNKIYKWVWVYLWEETFEAHIFDFNSQIYWEVIDIYVLYKIRENKKFDSFEELKNQISKDVEFAKNTTDNVLTFWTFDIFHEWHKYFLNNAKYWWDNVITIVATDENVLRFKKELPQNDENKRAKEILNSNIVSEVVIWKSKNPMHWIDLYKPKVVCLWYDQEGFSNMLKDYIKLNNLNIEIIRLEPYKEDIFKSSILKKIFWKK